MARTDDLTNVLANVSGSNFVGSAGAADVLLTQSRLISGADDASGPDGSAISSLAADDTPPVSANSQAVNDPATQALAPDSPALDAANDAINDFHLAIETASDDAGAAYSIHGLTATGNEAGPGYLGDANPDGSSNVATDVFSIMSDAAGDPNPNGSADNLVPDVADTVSHAEGIVTGLSQDLSNPYPNSLLEDVIRPDGGVNGDGTVPGDLVNQLTDDVARTTSNAVGAAGLGGTGATIRLATNHLGLGHIQPGETSNILSDTVATAQDLVSGNPIDGDLSNLGNDVNATLQDVGSLPGALADDLGAGAGLVGDVTGLAGPNSPLTGNNDSVLSDLLGPTGGEPQPLVSAGIGPHAENPLNVDLLSDNQDPHTLGVSALDSDRPQLLDAGVLVDDPNQNGILGETDIVRGTGPLASVLGAPTGSGPGQQPLVRAAIGPESGNPLGLDVLSDAGVGNTVGANLLDTQQPTLVDADLANDGQLLGGNDPLNGGDLVHGTGPLASVLSAPDGSAAGTQPLVSADIGPESGNPLGLDVLSGAGVSHAAGANLLDTDQPTLVDADLATDGQLLGGNDPLNGGDLLHGTGPVASLLGEPDGSAAGTQPLVSADIGPESANPLGVDVLSGDGISHSLGVNALDTDQPTLVNASLLDDGTGLTGADALGGADLAHGTGPLASVLGAPDGSDPGTQPLISADVGGQSANPLGLDVLSGAGVDHAAGVNLVDTAQPNLIDAGVLPQGADIVDGTGALGSVLGTPGDAGAQGNQPLVTALVGPESANPQGLDVLSDAGVSHALGVNAIDSDQPALLNAGVLSQGDQFQFASLGGAGADALVGQISSTAVTPATGGDVAADPVHVVSDVIDIADMGQHDAAPTDQGLQHTALL